MKAAYDFAAEGDIWHLHVYHIAISSPAIGICAIHQSTCLISFLRYAVNMKCAFLMNCIYSLLG